MLIKKDDTMNVVEPKYKMADAETFGIRRMLQMVRAADEKKSDAEPTPTDAAAVAAVAAPAAAAPAADVASARSLEIKDEPIAAAAAAEAA